MQLGFQSTPASLNAQINKLQYRLHRIENNRHLNEPGLAFLGSVSSGSSELWFRSWISLLEFSCTSTFSFLFSFSSVGTSSYVPFERWVASI